MKQKERYWEFVEDWEQVGKYEENEGIKDGEYFFDDDTITAINGGNDDIRDCWPQWEAPIVDEYAQYYDKGNDWGWLIIKILKGDIQQIIKKINECWKESPIICRTLTMEDFREVEPDEDIKRRVVQDVPAWKAVTKKR